MPPYGQSVSSHTPAFDIRSCLAQAPSLAAPSSSARSIVAHPLSPLSSCRWQGLMDDQLARGQQLELRPASRPIDQNSTDKKTDRTRPYRSLLGPSPVPRRASGVHREENRRGFRVRTAALTQQLLVTHSNSQTNFAQG